MRSLRRTPFFLIAIAAVSSILAGLGLAGAKDSPVVDSRRSETQTILTKELMEILPSGRNFHETLQLPRTAELRTEVSSSGKPTTTYFGNDQWSVQGSVSGYRKVEGSYELKKDRVTFPSGHTGNVRFGFHTLPNPRVNLRITNLRYQTSRLPDEVLTYIPVMTGQTPPDAGTPGTPGTPGGPAPGDTTPGFTGWQPRIGLTIRDGGLFSGSFKPRQHSAEECARHTINGVRLCNVLGSGSTRVEVFNVTPSGFGYRGVGGSIPNLSFGDGYCNVDRCETQGTFFDQPVRKTLDGWRASGTDLLADTSVFFNERQLRLDYRGRYFPSGSTETIVPPVVPYVPPPPPPPPGGFLIYAGGPTLPEGTRLNFEMSVLPHNTHEAHAVDWQGQRVYLCQKGVGVSEAVLRNIRPNMFDLVRTAPPRPGFQWSTFSCQRVDLGGPIACNGKGSFYGQDVLARGTTLIQPGSTSSEGTMDVEFVQTKSIVPFGIKYSF